MPLRQECDGLVTSAVPARAAFEAFAGSGRDGTRSASIGERIADLQQQIERLRDDCADETALDDLRRVSDELSSIIVHETTVGSRVTDGHNQVPLPGSGVDDQMPTYADLSHRIDQVEERLQLLTPEKISEVEFICRRATAQLRNLEDRRSPLPSADLVGISSKIAEWDEIAGAVPAVIERLLSTRELHERGASVLRRIAAMEDLGRTIDARILEVESALQAMRATLDRNRAVMDDNCSDLMTRMARLEEHSPDGNQRNVLL